MRFVSIALLLFGCASIHRQQAVGTTAIASRLHDKDGAAGVGGVGPRGKFICQYETETGSNIRKRVCRYEDDSDETILHREETRQAMRNIEVPLCLPEKDGGRCHAY